MKNESETIRSVAQSHDGREFPYVSERERLVVRTFSGIHNAGTSNWAFDFEGATYIKRVDKGEYLIEPHGSDERIIVRSPDGP